MNGTPRVCDRMLAMSDGARLFTRIILPSDGGKTYPTVFIRTPYDKETAVTEETLARLAGDPYLMRGCRRIAPMC